MKILTVTNPFEGHEVGDRIEEPSDIQTILKGEHAQHVLATESPDPVTSPARKTKPSNQE